MTVRKQDDLAAGLDVPGRRMLTMIRAKNDYCRCAESKLLSAAAHSNNKKIQVSKEARQIGLWLCQPTKGYEQYVE